MNLSDLARVEMLEKQFNKLKSIRALMERGKTPYVGVLNDSREQINFPVPFVLAQEMLDRQEAAIRQEFDKLNVKVDA